LTAFLLEWLVAIWVILVESGPYLLGGFLVAGALKVLIPERLVYRHLGQDNTKSVFLASLFGVPIPLCSCSVIPTAISLKRSGASKGATTSFLISTPETGVDSIGVTWALMDPIMTVVRPLSALLTAFTSGALVNRIVKRGWDDQPDEAQQKKLEEQSHDHDHDHGHSHDHGHDHEEVTHEAGCCHSDEIEEPSKTSWKAKGKDAWHYAFVTLMADLTPWFILGFLISGLITLVVPNDFFGTVLPNGWMSMTAMLFIGVPLYICATASTPVAAALIAKGLDPGSALILLLAGPATNIATIAVVRGFLGRRVLYAYLGSIAVCSMLLGWGVNFLYTALGTSPTTAVGDLTTEHSSMFAQLTGLILLALLLWHAGKLGLFRSWGGKLRGAFLVTGIDFGSKPAKLGVVLLLVAIYLSTGVSRVAPGQTGFVVRMGAVVETIEEPGMVVHAPLPFSQLEVVDSELLRAIRIDGPGNSLSLAAIAEIAKQNKDLARNMRMARIDLQASTEILTRDEYLLRCALAVHYQVTDAYAWLYATDSADDLVLAMAESALREAGLKRTADELLVGNRSDLQNDTQRLMQAALDKLGSGVQVSAVQLDEVHASADPSVHYAFRDVASALEDSERFIQNAEEYRARGQSRARAEAAALEQGAYSEADAVLQQALGETSAFLALIEVLQQNPTAHQLRLRLEAYERALAGRRVITVLDPNRVVVPMPKEDRGKTAPLFNSPTNGDHSE